MESNDDGGGDSGGDGGDNRKPPYNEHADPVEFFMHDCFYESD